MTRKRKRRHSPVTLALFGMLCIFASMTLIIDVMIHVWTGALIIAIPAAYVLGHRNGSRNPRTRVRRSPRVLGTVAPERPEHVSQRSDPVTRERPDPVTDLGDTDPREVDQRDTDTRTRSLLSDPRSGVRSLWNR